MTNLKFKRVISILLVLALIFTSSAPLLASVVNDFIGETKVSESIIEEVIYGDSAHAIEVNDILITETEVDTVLYERIIWLPDGNAKVEILDTEGNVVEEFLFVEPTLGYEIEAFGPPLAVFVAVRVWSISAHLWRTINVISTLTVGGLVHYNSVSAHNTISQNNQMRGQYFRAILRPADGGVLVNLSSPLTRAQAVQEIRATRHVYTFTQTNARNLAQAATTDLHQVVERPEHHARAGEVHFWHYHLVFRSNPSTRFGGHIWFGEPITR